MVPAARADLGQLGGAVLAGAHRRLLLAPRRCRSSAYVIGSFAIVTLLTKNTFIEEMRKQYVLVARAKGLSRAARAVASTSSATR